ncbi:MAG: 3'(2'),5'-bisphosphate nucleotidase CysQ [Bacteroidales bacterium]|jgi:3'(2'), 5'-bisphosphate nucleotidase|nr:3'(2'),5'-bisphosphate nucleotidase CysQ [Bacteroidales bacterium]
MTKDFFNPVLKTAVDAGNAILQIYNHENFEVELKSDNSPLTKADKKAHDIIVDALKKTEIPVLSEESEDKAFETRKNWERFWLVDPLDGTKEFIKRNGEFTVNIALIEKGIATAGIIYVPVSRELYFGISKQAAYKIVISEETNLENLFASFTESQQIKVQNAKDKLTIVGSRSHKSEETTAFISEIEKHFNTEMLSRGSSLKICMIAEGKAQLYPRFAPTMEWDTAAGHAIAVAAGAEIINWETGKALQYNKKNLRNPWFLVKPKGMKF